VYPDLVDRAERELNGLFNRKDYPTVAQLREKFAAKYKFRPLPSGDDFSVSLGSSADVDEIRKQIEEDKGAALKGAMTDLWQRLYDMVAHMTERLTPPTQDELKAKAKKAKAKGKGKKQSAPKKTFHDSMIWNLRDLCDVLPRLNIAGDPDLDSFHKK